MARRKRNIDQRALIPALSLSSSPATAAPSAPELHIAFTVDGVTHVRHCPSRVYYETLITLLPMFATDVRGSQDSSRLRAG